MAVYFYYGEEDFNIELEIEVFRSKLNQDFITMNYQALDNPLFSDLIRALRTTPMMFGNMLIVINAEKYFLSQKSFFDDFELAEIEDALQNNNDTLDIVFVVKIPRDEGKKLDSRRKLYKILSKFNTKEFATFKTYKIQEISTWIKNHAKKYKDLVLKDDAIELLIECVGNNLRQFDSELDKLKLMVYPEKVVTKDVVNNIVISNQDLFNLTEYLLKNQKDKALLEFKKLIDKKHPLEILIAVETMLRRWIILKTNSTKVSTLELSKQAGMHEYLVKQTIQKLKNTKISDLVKLKQNLFEVETKLKTAESLDIVSEVEIALIK